MNNICKIISVTLAIILSSCSKQDLNGEAFVTLNSGTSLKLTDMQVWFFDENLPEIQNQFYERQHKGFKEASATDGKINDNKREMLSYHMATLGFLSGGNISETRTDANGKFAIPSKAKYLIAFYERETPSEQMVWILPIKNNLNVINLTGANVTLNSDFSSSTFGFSILDVILSTAPMKPSGFEK